MTAISKNRFLICAALALLAALPAHAQGPTFPRDLNLDWVNASAYVDGTPIEAGDLASVRVSCVRNGESAPTVESVVPSAGPGLPQSHVLPGVIPRPGTYQCVAFSVSIDGTESGPSNIATVKHVGQPNPPSSFRANK